MLESKKKKNSSSYNQIVRNKNKIKKGKYNDQNGRPEDTYKMQWL